MTVRSVILDVRPLLKLFVIAWAALVSKVYYRKKPVFSADTDLQSEPSYLGTKMQESYLEQKRLKQDE